MAFAGGDGQFIKWSLCGSPSPDKPSTSYGQQFVIYFPVNMALIAQKSFDQTERLFMEF
jgi:hypothetical protein